MSTKATTANTPSNKLADDREKLIADLKLLVEDAKVFTTDASSSGKDFMHERAEDLKVQLNEGLDKLKGHYATAKDKTVEATDDLEKLIKKHPWRAIGIGVLVGVAVDRLLRD